MAEVLSQKRMVHTVGSLYSPVVEDDKRSVTRFTGGTLIE